MEIKTEQFNLELEKLQLKIQNHTKEVLRHLLVAEEDLDDVIIINDEYRKLKIIKINSNHSLSVKEYDDIENDEAFDISIENIDAYQLIELLTYIKLNILKE